MIQGTIWRQGRSFSVLTAGIASEPPLTFVNSIRIPGDWETMG